MGRITSNVGLITGLPITDTVDQLMEINAIPRENLFNRTDGLKSEQLAIQTLTSRLLSLQFDLNVLGKPDVYEAREVASDRPEVLSATIDDGGAPAVGDYRLRVAQVAATHQLVSQRFDPNAIDLGSGNFSFGVGGHVDQSAALEDLNASAGVARGKVRITDRSGATADIDLTTARSVDDVLRAINNNTTINITATTDGDQFVLTDNTGAVASNLIVQEVGVGTTAADLGLAGINVAAATATGSDVFDLHAGSKLADLNDGNGVRIIESDAVDDLQVNLASGEQLSVDLSDSATLGDVVDAINAVDNSKLSAAITDGRRITLTDLTSGGNPFSATSIAGSAAEDLGLTAAASSNTIAGNRLASGLRDTLVSSLNGGQGVSLGQIDITNRNGVLSTVDLASAETLTDIAAAIEAQATGIEASVNDARNGIVLRDVTGATASNLIVANNGASTTADELKIAASTAQSSIDSGSLDRQTLSAATTLDSLAGTAGIALGDLRITNSQGQQLAVDLNSSGNEAKTVGDVIDRINAVGGGISAALNDAGNGVLITDTSGGSGSLAIVDLSGDVAETLHLTRASTAVAGQTTQQIDGSSRYQVDLSDLDGSTEGIALASLNGGAGVLQGDIRITDSLGNVSSFDLNNPGDPIVTVDDLLDRLNSSAAGSAKISARINDAGNGIQIEDRAGGVEPLLIEDLGGSTVVNLRLDGPVSVVNGKQTVNGAGLFATSSANQNALEKLAARINAQEGTAVASVISDGVGLRLALTATDSGAANQLLIDAGGSTLEFTELTPAQDALLVLGDEFVPGSGILIASSDNQFNNVIAGVKLTAQAPSETAATVSVTGTDAELKTAIEDFVSSYNALRDELDELTAFDDEALTTGLLFGTSEALRVDTDLSRLVTDRYAGAGVIDSLQALGISVNDQGKLEFDAAALEEEFALRPDAVRQFFNAATTGFVDKFSAAIDRLAGEDNSVLTNSNDSLQATIDSNEGRLEQLDLQLERQRERLLLEFYQLEQLIASMQQNMTALQALQPIAPLTSSASN